jgi:hypothetical protein
MDLEIVVGAAEKPAVLFLQSPHWGRRGSRSEGNESDLRDLIGGLR